MRPLFLLLAGIVAFSATAVQAHAQSRNASIPGDQMAVIEDEAGDIAVVVNLSTRVGSTQAGLRKAVVRFHGGFQTVLLADCAAGTYYYVAYRSQSEFVAQVGEFARRFFDARARHTRPGTVDETAVRVVCTGDTAGLDIRTFGAK